MQCDANTLKWRGAQRRIRLPDCRASEVFQFKHHSASYFATVSRFSDGRIAEVFLDAKKPGSALSEHAHDAAILTSLLLQAGITVAQIIHSTEGPIATALRQAEGAQ
jgi:hypothetical protein